MKTVMIIGSRKSGKKNNPAIIARGLQDKGLRTQLVYWEDLLFEIETNNVYVSERGQDIFSVLPDVCIALGWYKNGNKSYYRDVAFAFAQILKAKHIPYWNAEMGTQRSTTKFSAMVQLALAGIPVPNTVFSIGNKASVEQREFPYIAKAASASRGESNFLVDSVAVLDQALAEEVPLLVQEFLQNDHDLRVICFGGKPRLVLRRARQQDAESHMNNTSQGGNADWLRLDQVSSELLTISEKISKITNRELAGIDFIPDEKSPFGYSCLEVNAIPQLTSGTDVETKIEALSQAIHEL